MTRRGIRDSSHGSVTLETIIIIPALFLLVNFALVCGRVMLVNAAARQAAEAAARTGSYMRTQAGAQAAGENTFFAYIAPTDALYRPLLGNNLRCSSEQGNGPDASALGNPAGPTSIGAASFYSFIAVCKIPVVRLPGLGGITITVTYTAYSPVDPYRCHDSPGQPC